MSDIKFNLIKAKKAKHLSQHEYPINLYLDYMRELNEKIVKFSEEKGYTNIINIAPSHLIKDRVYQELRDAGYNIELLDNGREINISWE